MATDVLNPGFAATQTMEEILARRKVDARTRMLDELAQREQESQQKNRLMLAETDRMYKEALAQNEMTQAGERWKSSMVKGQPATLAMRSQADKYNLGHVFTEGVTPEQSVGVGIGQKPRSGGRMITSGTDDSPLANAQSVEMDTASPNDLIGTGPEVSPGEYRGTVDENQVATERQSLTDLQSGLKGDDPLRRALAVSLGGQPVQYGENLIMGRHPSNLVTVDKDGKTTQHGPFPYDTNFLAEPGAYGAGAAVNYTPFVVDGKMVSHNNRTGQFEASNIDGQARRPDTEDPASGIPPSMYQDLIDANVGATPRGGIGGFFLGSGVSAEEEAQLNQAIANVINVIERQSGTPVAGEVREIVMDLLKDPKTYTTPIEVSVAAVQPERPEDGALTPQEAEQIRSILSLVLAGRAK